MITRLEQQKNTTSFQAILQAEMNYLKRGDHGRHNTLQWVFIWSMVVISLIAFVWRVINTIPQHPSLVNWLLFNLNFDVTNPFMPGGLNETIFPIMLLFPLCVMIWDLWLMFQTLIMSTNSIARERTGENWELLLLTNVSVRQIVSAKWWAVVRQQWTDYVLLALMRIGAVSLLAFSFDVGFSPGRFPYFSYGSSGPVVEPHITTVFLTAISIVLLSAALIAVLTMLNLMFTAACGIVAGSFTKRSWRMLPYGIGIRLLPVSIIAILAGVPSYLGLKPDIETFNYYPDPIFNTICLILLFMGITVLDNGGIAAGLLMRFGYDYRWHSKFHGFAFFSTTLRGHGPAFLTALLLSITIFGMLTCLLLRQAEWLFLNKDQNDAR
jgi:hypothetical protein